MPVLLQWRFNEADLWLPLATPALVQLPLALLIGLMGQYLLKRRKEEQMTRAIRYYLPENVVRDLAERQVDPTTLNRVVFGTCLATDMSDFIALAESKSPHELAVFMNDIFRCAGASAQAPRRRRDGVSRRYDHVRLDRADSLAGDLPQGNGGGDRSERYHHALCASNMVRVTSSRGSDSRTATSMSGTPAAEAAFCTASSATRRTPPRGWRA